MPGTLTGWRRVRRAAAVIQSAPAAPQLEQKARGGNVRVRHDARGGGRPVPGGPWGDSFQMLVPLGTFLFKHDVLSDKSNGELFPTAVPSKLRNRIPRQAINSEASRDLL